MDLTYPTTFQNNIPLLINMINSILWTTFVTIPPTMDCPPFFKCSQVTVDWPSYDWWITNQRASYLALSPLNYTDCHSSCAYVMTFLALPLLCIRGNPLCHLSHFAKLFGKKLLSFVDWIMNYIYSLVFLRFTFSHSYMPNASLIGMESVLGGVSRNTTCNRDLANRDQMRGRAWANA